MRLNKFWYLSLLHFGYSYCCCSYRRHCATVCYQCLCCEHWRKWFSFSDENDGIYPLNERLHQKLNEVELIRCFWRYYSTVQWFRWETYILIAFAAFRFCTRVLQYSIVHNVRLEAIFVQIIAFNYETFYIYFFFFFYFNLSRVTMIWFGLINNKNQKK